MSKHAAGSFLIQHASQRNASPGKLNSGDKPKTDGQGSTKEDFTATLPTTADNIVGQGNGIIDHREEEKMDTDQVDQTNEVCTLETNQKDSKDIASCAETEQICHHKEPMQSSPEIDEDIEETRNMSEEKGMQEPSETQKSPIEDRPCASLTDDGGTQKPQTQSRLSASLTDDVDRKRDEEEGTSDLDSWKRQTEAELERLKKENMEKDAVIKNLEEDKQGMTQEMDRMEKQYSRMENELRYKGKCFEEEKEKCYKMNQEIEDLTTRLAKEMDAKVSAQESSIENVSIKNRPMNVADDFSILSTDQWQDAKEAIDRCSEDETDKLRLLCDIMMMSQDQAQKALDRLCRVIVSPLTEITSDSDRVVTESSLPQNLYTELSNYLKRSSDNISITPLEQGLRQSLESKCQGQETDTKDDGQHISSLWPMVKENDSINAYVSSACRLAWNMVIQRPPMRFTVDGIGEPWKGAKVQELFWTSVDPSTEGAKVVCYTHPKLWLGNELKTPGKVLLK